MITTQEIKELNKKYQNATPQEIIKDFLQIYGNKIGFATSLGIEDQVITEMIANIDVKAHIFTLDTARLFPETYDLIEKTERRYKVKLKIYFPESSEVEKMVNEKGIALYYDSIENRKLCCNIRKLRPLKRAFIGLDAWFCGLRKEQAVTRKDTQLIEWDENNNLLKINPLISWSEENTWKYIKENKIPYNVLHDKGFPSIGCQPCTRAIEKDEDVRAGRWWWENPETKECGLHKK